MAYPVVETSKIAAVRGGGHIYSLIAETNIANGSVGYVGALDTDVEGVETREYLEPATAILNTQKLVLIANPEWSYQTGMQYQAPDQFVNPAGIPFRAFDLMAGDVFAISAEGLNDPDDALAVGKYLIPADGENFLTVVDLADTESQGFAAKIIATVQRGYGFSNANGATFGSTKTMYLVEVMRNEIVIASVPPDTAQLSALTIGSLTLTPAFDADVTTYTAATTNVKDAVTATGADSATVAITVNGNAHTSGNDATWDLGENTVVVTASKSGYVTTTYTVTVTKS